MNYQRLEMPIESYLADPSCSPTILKLYGENPMLCKMRQKQTLAMKQGIAFHAVMDGTFKQKYLRGPHGPLNRNPWKEEKKRLVEENPDKEVLSSMQYDGYIEMADSVLLHRTIGPLLLRSVEREMSYFWNDSEGVPCKARPDQVTDDGIILDMKSTTFLSPNWWRDAHKFGYDLSVAHYLDEMLPFTDYVFIVVSKFHPYFAMKWELDKGALRKAQERIRELRDGWWKSTQANSFENIYDREFLIPERPFGFTNIENGESDEGEGEGEEG